jgi:TPR repeat protein
MAFEMGKMGLRNVVTALAVVWLSASVVLGAQKPADPWRDFDLGEVRVEGVLVRYDKSLKPEMDGIKKSISHFVKKDAANFAEVKRLGDKSSAFVEQVNKIIGFSPDKEQKAWQRKIFTDFLDMGNGLRLNAPGRKITVYIVMRKSTKDYLRKGGKLPGFAYDKTSDKVSFEWQIKRSTREKVVEKDIDLVIPLKAEAVGEVVSEFLGMVSQMSDLMGGAMALHEMVEMTLLVHMLKPRDPYCRWFSDGFANAISIRVLKNNGEEKSAARLADAYEVTKHAALLGKVNLQYWMTLGKSVFDESPRGALDSEGDLEQARYSYATHEAVRLIDRHGIGCVAKILAKTCAIKGGASGQDVLNAVSEVTGEDIAKRFLRYQSFKTRAEGLGVYTKQYQTALAGGDYEIALGALLRMYELQDKRDFQAVCDQAAKLLFKLGRKDAGDRVVARAKSREKGIFERIVKDAKDGNPKAMYDLGCMYNHGAGEKKNFVEALKWFVKAAQAGHPQAMHYLGVNYYTGKVVKKDLAKAMKWLRLAAQAEHSDAMGALGAIYGKGEDVKQDSALALKWLGKAADVGNAGAMLNLARMYGHGKGVKTDLALSAKWYRKAAATENAEAMYNLGLMYKDGQGVKKDLTEAVKWFRKSAEAGDLKSMVNMGVAYVRGQGVRKDIPKSLEWFRKAAQAGDMQSAFNLGAIYRDGKVVKKDPAEAIKWFRKAAEGGSMQAMCNLGIMYRLGEGAKRDDAEAMKWAHKLVEAAGPLRAHRIGMAYAQGKGFKRDLTEAAWWYRHAAEAGFVPSMYNLADAYRRGLGVKVDKTEADKWSARAAAARKKPAISP